MATTGRLVDAPSGPSVFQNLGFPVLAGKRHRHEVRQIALAGAVVFLQEFHGCLEVLSGLRDAEVEGLQKRRRETPQLGVAPRGQGQGVLGRQVLEGGDLLARPEQAVPADLFIEDGERSCFCCRARTMASRVPPKSRISRPTCGLLSDQERSCRFFERVNSWPARRSNMAIAASVSAVSSSNIWAARVAMRRRSPKSLSRWMAQPLLPWRIWRACRMNVLAQVFRQPELPYELSLSRSPVEARRAGGMRQCAQPGQTRLPEGVVVPEQFLQNTLAGFLQGVVEGLCRSRLARARSGQAGWRSACAC